MDQNYRFCILDKDGRIVKADDHACADDLAALDKAKQLSAEAEIEVWQDARRVARVKIGDEDLNERDRLSL